MKKTVNKSSLNKRAQQSYDNRDSGGSNRGVFDWSKTEADFEFFKPEKDTKYRVNIIPYVITSKLHPLVAKGEMSVGDLDYVMDLWVHRNIGPAEVDVVCLKKSYGKACAICEAQERYRKEGETENADALKASRRVASNFLSEGAKSTAKVQVFEASHYLFEKELIEEARADGDGELVNFYDPEEGKAVCFRASEQKGNGRSYMEYKGWSFEERKKPLADDVYEKAVSFDECLKLHSYEEQEAILYGNGSAEEEDEEEAQVKRPGKAGKKPARPADDEDEEEEEDLDDEEEEEEEETPAPKKQSKATKKPDPVDEDEEAEEEAPAPKKPAKPAKENQCPHGYNWGEADKHKACDKCKRWSDCTEAQAEAQE